MALIVSLLETSDSSSATVKTTFVFPQVFSIFIVPGALGLIVVKPRISVMLYCSRRVQNSSRNAVPFAMSLGGVEGYVCWSWAL